MLFRWPAWDILEVSCLYESRVEKGGTVDIHIGLISLQMNTKSLKTWWNPPVSECIKKKKELKGFRAGTLQH